MTPEIMERMNAVKRERNVRGLNVHYIRADGTPDCFSFNSHDRATAFSKARAAEGLEIISPLDSRAIQF